MSVVIAAHNAAGTLAETVNSILTQTYRDFELIIVDDGSTDETPRVLDRLVDGRIVRLRNDENLGVSKARNRGDAVARGEFIVVHDADDLSAPERLARQVDYLDSHPEIGLVGSQGVLLVDGQVTPMTVPLTNGEIQALLLGENCLFHSSLMIRKPILERVGGYDESYPAALDYDLVLRLAEVTDVANLPEALYIKRSVKGSISYSARGLLQKRCVVQAIDQAVTRRRNRGEPAVAHPKYALACLKAACAEAAFGSGDNVAAYVRRALETDPAFPLSGRYAAEVANLAVDYAVLSGSPAGDALAILDDLLVHWPPGRGAGTWSRHARSHAAANLAFTHYRHGDWGNAMCWATKSLRISPVRHGNLGLVSIGVRSVVHTLGLRGSVQ